MSDKPMAWAVTYKELAGGNWLPKTRIFPRLDDAEYCVNDIRDRGKRWPELVLFIAGPVALYPREDKP